MDENKIPFALQCVNISKRFGGLDAVKGINLCVNAGERRAIIGPNGAGKTTFFRLISGEFPVSSGKIRLFGKDITYLSCHKRAYLGLGRTFQITTLFPTLTVLENLIIAAMALKGMKFSMLRPLFTYRAVYDRVNEIIIEWG